MFLRFLMAKWRFNKPKKRDFLIYDKESEKTLYLICAKKDCEVLDIRYESINFYIIFITLMQEGIKNFKNNYKLNYIKAVSPKIIITTFNWNPSFFKLKDIYNKAIYINIISNNVDSRFIDECNKYYSNKKNKRLKADHIFLPGKYYKDIFSNIVDSKIHILGSFLNNHFYLEEKKKIDQIQSILFISQINPDWVNDRYGTYRGRKNKLDREVIIFSALYNYCQKKKYKLNFCAKYGASFENYYRDKHVKGDWNFFPKRKLGSSYDLVNNSQLIVFTNSSLGLEALVKGMRCLSFPPETFPIADFGKKYPADGPFWSCTFSYEIMENYIEKILKYSDEEWSEIIKKNIGDIMEYNPKNTKLFSILKKNDLQHSLQ